MKKKRDELTEAREDSTVSRWCIRLTGGSMAWSSWPLTARPLRIGRGLGCNVRLEDIRVSRLQCEIWLEDGQPHVRNLSGSNETLMNGSACQESALQLGDVIDFAGFRLVVDRFTNLQSSPEEPSSSTLTTRTLRDTPYRESADSEAHQVAEIGSSSLLSLFHLSRKLATQQSVDELVLVLQEHLQCVVAATSLWIAWPLYDGKPVSLISPDNEATAPIKQLAVDAVSVNAGLISDDRRHAVVPLRCRNQAIGALCIDNQSGNEINDCDLDYLLAVAEITGPLLMILERMEQLDRDSGKSGLASPPELRLLGESSAIEQLRDQIRNCAATSSHVLLIGESGTGKELAARILHDLSCRSEGPYVAVNSAAIPSDLFESEMFGHERGAFTGANQRQKGLFEAAHGGTLFLDEVAELNSQSQARLLRVADDGRFRRVGAVKEIQVDVRIVSATNAPLPELDEKRFRSDLFYRLSGMLVHLPPLRDRRVDIPILAGHFLRRCAPHSSSRPIRFSPEALKCLKDYDWPGNVRELRNVVERACLLAKGPVIEQVDVPLAKHRVDYGSKSRTLRLDEVERRQLEEVLNDHNGEVASAAKSLGIPKSTMYFKLAKHGISLRKRG